MRRGARRRRAVDTRDASLKNVREGPRNGELPDRLFFRIVDVDREEATCTVRHLQEGHKQAAVLFIPRILSKLDDFSDALQRHVFDCRFWPLEQRLACSIHVHSIDGARRRWEPRCTRGRHAILALGLLARCRSTVAPPAVSARIVIARRDPSLFTGSVLLEDPLARPLLRSTCWQSLEFRQPGRSAHHAS